MRRSKESFRKGPVTQRAAWLLALLVNAFRLNDQFRRRKVRGDRHIMDIAHPLQGVDVRVVWVSTQGIKEKDYGPNFTKRNARSDLRITT